jgi:hypothetical protein
MVIKEKFLPICDHCPHFTMDAHTIDFHADFIIAYREIEISCRNIEVCKRAMNQKAPEQGDK